MKNFIVKIMLFCSFCFVGFSSATKITEENSLQEREKMVQVASHSFLTEDDIGLELVITGQVSFNQETGVFLLTENSQSRSRVIFVIEENKKIAKKLEALVNASITVQGTLQGVFSPWVKSLKITKIL